jgi:predicted nucleic acid-binding Zn ribbon protein
MKKEKDPLVPLKDIISNIFAESKLPFNPNDALIWKIWDEAVGPAIAKNARPQWIKNGRLRVGVSDPIWLQELEFAGETIKEKLNGRLGREAVEKIEFRLGSKP